MTINTTLLEVIAETLEIETGQLTPQTRFDDLGRTSFQEVELFTAIEDRFDVRLDFTTYTTLATVGELADAVSLG